MMTQTSAGISVILCAYTCERIDDLVAAVASVQQQTLPPCEIIVVVDHNPALLAQAYEQLPGVVVIENTEQQGLSGARNCGIAIASGEWIAFLDDDALATPDWLQSLIQGYIHPHVWGTGGPVLPLWSGKAPAWFPEEFYWVVGCTYRGMAHTLQEIRNPIGANMSFRRELFRTAGGFRSEIGRVGKHPIGCEETEFCIRARQQFPGSIFLYCPQARVFHRVPKRRSTWRYFCVRCYCEGLSKAIVARYVGRQDALASERAYILRTLPLGVVRHVTDALLHRKLAGLLRALAIVVGLASTAMGYLVGTVLSRHEKKRRIRECFQ
jgi:GT2 family glycosyltransferase